MQHCSLQHWILLSSQTYPRHHVCFSPVAAFFLELLVIVLCSSQIAYWTTSNLGGSSLGVIFFLSFYTVHGVLMANILEQFAIPSSSRSRFVRTLHYDLFNLGDPAWHGSQLH